MLELATGTVLATAAGLNAYIPLLGLGLLARFSGLLTLPEGWHWLENEWVMGVLAVLLIVEFLVDKIPAADTVNDVLQTVVRPASGGLVLSAGAASSTVAVSDPAAFVSSGQIWPFVLGIVIALIPHGLKALSRPVLNAVTGGAAAPVLSTAEDAGAVTLTVLAFVVPLVALLLAVLVVWFLVHRLRKFRRMRNERRASNAKGPAPVWEPDLS